MNNLTLQNTLVTTSSWLGPTLENEFDRFGKLPAESLYMGTAVEDKLPVLLNMEDPTPGAILAFGNEASNFHLLKCVALAAVKMHPANELRIALLTSRAKDWIGIQSHCVPMEELVKEESLYRYRLLLIDGFEHVEELRVEMREFIYWLISQGAKKRIWTIATMRGEMNIGWMEMFKTPIYSLPGDRFWLCEGYEHLDFRIPAI